MEIAGNEMARALETATRSMRASDVVMAAYLAVEAGLILLARTRLEKWWILLLVHGALLAGVVLLARVPAGSKPRALRLLRDFYPVLYIPLIFKQLAVLVPAVNPGTWDARLLSWDRAIFGGYPGRWFDALASPILTEILRACWLSYFLLPFVVAVPLYLRRDRAAFQETVSVLVTGWLLSFLGYYAFPALGPGYFPDAVPAPACVDHSGATGRIALALFSLEGPMMRDIFPSGHTIIAMLALYQAFRHRLWFRYLLVPVTAGLLAGTVYLRYHYGVDVAAGAVVAVAVVLCFRVKKRRVPSFS